MYALRSHQKASFAQQNGFFNDEIIPVSKNVKNPKGEITKHLIMKDEGIRHGVTLQQLVSLKPVFKINGVSHGGNSSQMSDRAAGVISTSRKKQTS